MKEFFSSAKIIFRLELLQQYSVPEERESLEKFYQHNEVQLPKGHEDWLTLIRNVKSRGARIIRLVVLEFPLTNYKQWELAVHMINNQAGEEIIIISKQESNSLHSRIEDDFWLFDEVAFVMSYSQEGKFLGREQADNPQKYIQFTQEVMDRFFR